MNISDANCSIQFLFGDLKKRQKLFFETSSHIETQGDLELTMLPKLALNIHSNPPTSQELGFQA